MLGKLTGWDDTIVALATAPGIGALGVIRLSGPDSIKIVKGLFPSKDLSKQATHTLHVGLLKNGEEVLDEVVDFHLPRTEILYRRRCGRNKLSRFSTYRR